MDDLYLRPLKNAGSKAIEDAIEKAICELTGKEYEVNIRAIDFGDDGLSYTQDIVKITLSASKVFKGFGQQAISDTETASPTSS